jgi:hypothetical protein
MDKEFYDAHRGSRCPDKLFSKDVRKIKSSLDTAMDMYHRDVTPQEIEALFLAGNPTLTSAQKEAYTGLFTRIKSEAAMGSDIAQDVLSKLFRQVVGEEVANLGFDYINGVENNLQPLHNLLEHYGDDFTPDLNIEWEDISLDTILEMTGDETRWKFNLATLSRKVGGINGGHLIMLGARSNVGKSSFQASIVAGPDGFVDQGARVIVLCNEEAYHRLGLRYASAATGMTRDEIQLDKARALSIYSKVSDNLLIKDATGRDMAWVESVCKTYKPDVVILDMGDKFADMRGYTRPDEALKANAIYARQIAKEHDCALIYISQLSAEAEGKIYLNQGMLEGSKTGKASETDLMLLLSRNPVCEGSNEEEDKQRHITVAKNKLTGWHGMITCNLEYKIARYTA